MTLTLNQLRTVLNETQDQSPVAQICAKVNALSGEAREVAITFLKKVAAGEVDDAKGKQMAADMQKDVKTVQNAVQTADEQPNVQATNQAPANNQSKDNAQTPKQSAKSDQGEKTGKNPTQNTATTKTSPSKEQPSKDQSTKEQPAKEPPAKDQSTKEQPSQNTDTVNEDFKEKAKKIGANLGKGTILFLMLIGQSTWWLIKHIKTVIEVGAIVLLLYGYTQVKKATAPVRAAKDIAIEVLQQVGETAVDTAKAAAPKIQQAAQTAKEIVTAPPSAQAKQQSQQMANKYAAWKQYEAQQRKLVQQARSQAEIKKLGYGMSYDEWSDQYDAKAAQAQTPSASPAQTPAQPAAVKENTRITLTLAQLRRLVSEVHSSKSKRK